MSTAPDQKVCTKCGHSKELTRFRIASPKTGNRRSQCKDCANAASMEWHKANREHQLEQFRKRYYANPESNQARTAVWRQNNPEKARDYLAKWRAENAEHVKAGNNRRLRDWKKLNTGAVNADTAKRYATKTCATPQWSDKALVREVYEQAAQQRAAGVDCHVDHIVPLRSKLVCGLHVPANLRIIPKSDNQKKGNRSWPDQA